MVRVRRAAAEMGAWYSTISRWPGEGSETRRLSRRTGGRGVRRLRRGSDAKHKTLGVGAGRQVQAAVRGKAVGQDQALRLGAVETQAADLIAGQRGRLDDQRVAAAAGRLELGAGLGLAAEQRPQPLPAGVVEIGQVERALALPAVDLLGRDPLLAEVGAGHIVRRIHKEEQDKDDQVDADQDGQGVQRAADDIGDHGASARVRAGRPRR